MATRLRHYDGKFGPACPEGWRRVEVGETLCVGDRVWVETDHIWKDCPLAGVEVTSGHWIRIRRIDPAPDAAPVAAAPASVGSPCRPDGKPVVVDVPKLPRGYRFATAHDYVSPKPDHALYFESGDGWESVFPDLTYHQSTVYALPIADAPQDAPEKADCPYCDELRRQLEATLRRVEAEQSCRQIAENACVAAEKACVYHQGEADKAREERDDARAFSAAAHKEMDELRIQLRSAHDAWAVVERERDAARRERDAALVVLRVLCGRDE